MHKIVQTLNLEEGERTEKVTVVLLGNGAQEKEIKDYLWFVSIEIAQPHDIEVGKKEDERMMIIALRENWLVIDEKFYNGRKK